MLYDSDHETAHLVYRTAEDLGKPLDLTHSYLKTTSLIDIDYLRIMAVRSSMSVPTNVSVKSGASYHVTDTAQRARTFLFLRGTCVALLEVWLPKILSACLMLQKSRRWSSAEFCLPAITPLDISISCSRLCSSFSLPTLVSSQSATSLRSLGK